MDIGPSEAETFWTEFLRKLARRGLRGVKLVISDAHEGIKAAISKVLHASWQRCRVHFMRNVLAHAGRQAVASSPPSLAPLSFRTTPRPRASNGARSPISCVLKCRSSPRSWTRRRPMSLPSWLPEGSSAKNPLHQSVGTPQQRDQAPHRCRRHLPQRRCDHAPHRRAAAQQNDEWAVQRGRYMSLETIAPLAMIQSSSCPQWQPDRPGPAGDHDGLAVVTPNK